MSKKSRETVRNNIVVLQNAVEIQSVSDFENTFLEKRGVQVESSESFFDPKFCNLHDPFLFPQMSLAVDRILAARERKERVVIF